MNHINTTFTRGGPTWAHACVGKNGFPGYWEYAKGFSQAANTLIDTVLQGQGLEHSVDELVYPVCFNMRHSVELRLKAAILDLLLIQTCRGKTLNSDFVQSHDIGRIWSFFVEQSQVIDDRYKHIIELLDEKIRDFAEVDATGQTFRYPLNTESQRHLVNVANISFVVLKNSFIYLEDKLDDLYHLSKYLCDEYSLGSFTKKLSRKNIFEVASLLPPKSEWHDELFDVTKKNIKKRFGIGSKDLSDCIMIIEAHFELAPQIEMSVPLLGVTASDIHDFFVHWVRLHGLPACPSLTESELIELGVGVTLQTIENDYEIINEIWMAFYPSLTSVKLAGLSALFYFANDLRFSETYRDTFEDELQDAKLAFDDSGYSINSKFLHIIYKTNAIKNILLSLYFLKKFEIAERLVEDFDLDNIFFWLDDVRCNAHLRKPDYCGYAI